MRNFAILKLLKEDHKQILSLFTQLESLGTSSKERRKNWDKLRRELTRQSIIREDLVFPRLNGKNELRWLARPAVAFQGYLDRLLNQLEYGNFGSERWEETLREMKSAVKEYMELEREKVYQTVCENLTPRELEKFQSKMLKSRVA